MNRLSVRLASVAAAAALTASAVPAPTVEASAPRHPTPSRAPSPCDQEPQLDAAGDGDIDIASVTITSNCRNKVEITLTTHQPFTDADLDAWFVLIGNENSACPGASIAFVAEVHPFWGLNAAWYPVTADCRLDLPRSSTVRRLSDRSLRITDTEAISPEGGYSWFSYTRAVGGDRTDGASRFNVLAQPRLIRPDIQLTPAYDGRSLTVAWGTAQRPTRVDYQYRRRGRKWSPVRSSTASAFTIRGLTPNATYEVRVAAATRFARSEWATRRLRTVAPIGPVRNVSARWTPDGLAVSFAPPASNGGELIGSYSVRYRASGEGTGAIDLSTPDLRVTLKGVTGPGLLTIVATTTSGVRGPLQHVEIPETPPA